VEKDKIDRSYSGHVLGKKGEEIAVKYLQKWIQDRRARPQALPGELDIIALDRAILVFVEAKTRRGRSSGSQKRP